MTTDNRACKNCISYTDRGECTKGKNFLTDQFTTDGERIVTTPHRNSVCAQHQMRKGLPKVFYIRPSTCANCFQFIAVPTELEHFPGEITPAGCGNGCEMCISTDPEGFRPMRGTDPACEEHITQAEVDFENERDDPHGENMERTLEFCHFLQQEEQKIQARKAAEVAAARQSEASAERITMQVLGKLRKGGAK